MRAFLCSLFDSVQERVAKLKISLKNGMIGYRSVSDCFYRYFQDQTRRDSFYEAVVEKSNLRRTATQMEASHALARVVAHLAMICSDWDPTVFCPIIMSVDEVHILFTARSLDVQGSYTLYSRWKSVLSELVQQPFCVVFLSTVSNISKLAPAKWVADSLREQAADLLLPAPFTEVSFDVHIIADPLVPGKETIASVGSFGFTAKFGRPMSVYNIS
jgi:hypothetical protein